MSIFALVRYLAREYLLIFATSSSESALPRLIAKMEHLGVQPSTVGIVVPTGYSFNLDGTAIYLTMASLFIADVMGAPMSVSQQVGLLAFMIVASKGAAGVSGADQDRRRHQGQSGSGRPGSLRRDHDDRRTRLDRSGSRRHPPDVSSGRWGSHRIVGPLRLRRSSGPRISLSR